MKTDTTVTLTTKQYEVLLLTAKGIDRRQQAEMLGCTIHAVIGRLKKVYEKLGVHTEGEAVYEAFQLGILKVEKFD